MDGLAIVIRDLIRQILAYGLPGSILLFSSFYALYGIDSIREATDGLWIIFLPVAYGASVAIGFSLHCISVALLFKNIRPKRGTPGRESFIASHRSYWQWLGKHEALFQSSATEQAKQHHGRLTGHWQMCTTFMLSGVLTTLLLLANEHGPKNLCTIWFLVFCGLVVAMGLIYGHYFMKTLVEDYENKVINLAGHQPIPRPGSLNGSDTTDEQA